MSSNSLASSLYSSFSSIDSVRIMDSVSQRLGFIRIFHKIRISVVNCDSFLQTHCPREPNERVKDVKQKVLDVFQDKLSTKTVRT